MRASEESHPLFHRVVSAMPNNRDLAIPPIEGSEYATGAVNMIARIKNRARRMAQNSSNSSNSPAKLTSMDDVRYHNSRASLIIGQPCEVCLVAVKIDLRDAPRKTLFSRSESAYASSPLDIDLSAGRSHTG